jgi:transposase InsO family protein
VRRFERARPGELWQSDITSFLLTRHRQRVYLTVFLDDHSRYIVSHSLRTRQTSDLVTETLLDGIARFGKPKEVLTDQAASTSPGAVEASSRSYSCARASSTWWPAHTLR